MRPRSTVAQRWRRARSRVRRFGLLLAHHPSRAAALVVEFLLRWALRIVLPLAGASAMLHLFPYHAEAGGVHFTVQATLFTRSGLTADTTIGNWEFPNLNTLPIGVHVTPENVDVVTMASAAVHNGEAFAERLRADFLAEVPSILAWLAGEAFVGFLVGLAVAAAINLAVRHLRGEHRRRHELRHRAVQFAGAFAVLLVVAVVGLVSYNPHWTKQSRLTGTLAALQLFPDQLQQYYQQQATAFDVVSGIAAIQAQLQQNIEQKAAPPTSFNIMYISDMHLASTYPLVREYARNFDVKLVVNTGDETLFGTAAEMTPSYLQQVRDLTEIAPMVWVPGNHDSPTTVEVMRSIPGVIVLGTKTVGEREGYDVTAGQVRIYGLNIAGLPDPRVYGAAGAWGSNTPDVVDPLERKAASDAVAALKKAGQPEKSSRDGTDGPTAGASGGATAAESGGTGSGGGAGEVYFDIFATHEPAAGEQLIKELPKQIRQLNTGHVHKQNAQEDIQRPGWINLVEGSTGAGGLKELDPAVVRAPIEFTVESVAADCQFTKVVRFQVQPDDDGSDPTSGALPAVGQNVTASTLYLKPQPLQEGRSCSVADGIGPARPLP